MFFFKICFALLWFLLREPEPRPLRNNTKQRQPATSLSSKCVLALGRVTPALLPSVPQALLPHYQVLLFSVGQIKLLLRCDKDPSRRKMKGQGKWLSDPEEESQKLGSRQNCLRSNCLMISPPPGLWGSRAGQSPILAFHPLSYNKPFLGYAV